MFHVKQSGQEEVRRQESEGNIEYGTRNIEATKYGEDVRREQTVIL
jgi:hypothetical protein